MSNEAKGNKNSSNLKLVNAFNQNIAKGYSVAEVKRFLMDNGYSQKAIDDAASAVTDYGKSEFPKTATNKSNKNLIILIAILAIVVIMILSVASYAGFLSFFSGQSKGITSVNSQDPTKFLPSAQPGYTAGIPQGDTINVGQTSMINVFRTDTATDQSKIDILISNFPLSVAIATNIASDYQADDGYVKAINVKGYSAKETYKTDGNKYAVFVMVNKIVVVTGGTSRDVVYAYANSIDYAGIATLV